MKEKPPLYAVVEWDRHYENAQSRKIDDLRWVPIPNKFDGDGYTALLDHPDGVKHLAAWYLIVSVASRCTPRGTLRRANGEPHTPESLARMTRVPAEVFAGAFARLADSEIGWLSALGDDTKATLSSVSTSPPVGYQSATTSLPVESHPATSPLPLNGMELNGTELNGKEGKNTPDAPRRGEPCFPASSPDTINERVQTGGISGLPTLAAMQAAQRAQEAAAGQAATVAQGPHGPLHEASRDTLARQLAGAVQIAGFAFVGQVACQELVARLWEQGGHPMVNKAVKAFRKTAGASGHKLPDWPAMLAAIEAGEAVPIGPLADVAAQAAKEKEEKEAAEYEIRRAKNEKLFGKKEQ